MRGLASVALLALLHLVDASPKPSLIPEARSASDGSPTPTPPSTATTCSSPVPTSTTCPPPHAATARPLAGVNIAGFEFGCDASGSCDIVRAVSPLDPEFDGAGQMEHFVRDDGFSVFRLPVSWQFLTAGTPTATLDEGNFARYDDLVQACLATGAYCVLDLHNAGRWEGEAIGEMGPSAATFGALWGNIAGRYNESARIIYGLSSDPITVPDITLWADAVQAAVNAIRNAGSAYNFILLPGNNWDPTTLYPSACRVWALNDVYGPDFSTIGLIFDIRLYLDANNTGTSAECVTNNIEDILQPLASWLRCNGRRALITETGGGNTASCAGRMCEQVAYLNANPDGAPPSISLSKVGHEPDGSESASVFLGYIGWAAGAYNASTYVLSETPTRVGNGWLDTPLVKECLAPENGASSGSSTYYTSFPSTQTLI